MLVLTGSVGEKGSNKKGEVKKIQQLLNKNLYLLPGIKKLSEDDRIGKFTIEAITAY